MMNPEQAASKPESHGRHRTRSPIDGAGHLREERLTCSGHHHSVVVAATAMPAQVCRDGSASKCRRTASQG